MRLLFIYDEPGKLIYVDFAPENKKENVSPSEADDLINGWNEEAGYEAFRIVETNNKDIKEMAKLLVPRFNTLKEVSADLGKILDGLENIIDGLSVVNDGVGEIINAAMKCKRPKKTTVDGIERINDGLSMADKGVEDIQIASKSCIERLIYNSETKEEGKDINALTITVNMTGRKPN